MGKVDENKHQKMDALFQSAYDLFLNQGIEKTSISDIAKKAGVAKGTFYLYFADKYEIRSHGQPADFSREHTKLWRQPTSPNSKIRLFLL